MKRNVEYLIIGAGPAGLQMGLFLQESDRDYLILEQEESAGSFYKNAPRHHRLTTINKRHSGFDGLHKHLRWDWNSLLDKNSGLNMRDYSDAYHPERSDYFRYLNDVARIHDLNIAYESRVESVRQGNEFEVDVNSGCTIFSDNVIVATGLSQPYVPNIPGIENTVNYMNMPVERKDFSNKRVLIVGKGNAALETASHLLAYASVIHLVSPNPIQMAWRTHSLFDVRACNADVLEACALGSRCNIVNGEILKIDLKHDKFWVSFNYSSTDGELEVVEYDEVITATGMQLDQSIFSDTCRPKVVIQNRFPEMHSWYESVNVPNLYFIGSLMQQRDYQRRQSSFVHGFRSNIEFLANYFLKKLGLPCRWPVSVPLNAVDVGKEIMLRANQSASLWLQDGHYCDLIIFSREQELFHYYCSVPVDYVRESGIADGAHYFILTLEHGLDRINKYQNIFAVDKVNREDYQHAAMSTSIHPIVRHYHHHQLLSEHHVIEDIDDVWEKSVHIDPLLDYLMSELALIKIEVACSQVEFKSKC